MSLDWSGRGWARVWAVSVLGTLICMAFAMVFDSYSFATGEWRWGSDPLNNVLIPMLIAPPFFFLLMAKMRELAIAHHELLTVAATDSLTSLLNRRAFTEMVDGYLKRVEKAPDPDHDGMLLIDVDHFKRVNDSFGHELGDQALKMIAATIAANVRDTDLVGRVGGEEFGVFLPAQPASRISAVAERIRHAVSEVNFVAEGRRHPLSISIGGVIFPPGPKFADFYRAADERLYAAKHNGRNRVEISAQQPPGLPEMQPQPTLH